MGQVFRASECAQMDRCLVGNGVYDFKILTREYRGGNMQNVAFTITRNT